MATTIQDNKYCRELLPLLLEASKTNSIHSQNVLNSINKRLASHTTFPFLFSPNKEHFSLLTPLISS